ncbi:MAG: hypothetical protein FWC09_02290 [Lachnospiraceae bacterium]|nr:hypothetical protein [Lachnospiraceae bacterium]
MANILKDKEIEGLLGTVIINGMTENIRPNSYIIRLGSEGEFLGTGKSFVLGEKREQKKGIILPPGHSVGVSSIEQINFTKETVDELFPKQALHGFLAPTTDLSREGIVVSSTQIDAGFNGSLNWTLTNTSSQERRYIYGEKLFRLTIFKLDESEVPQTYYSGSYQSKMGYVRSNRMGAPVGMQESEWEEPFTDDGIEESLERLMKAGYPWQAVASQLKMIDNQFSMVSTEYQQIYDSIEVISNNVNDIENSINNSINNTINTIVNQNLGITVNSAVKDGITQLYNWALIRLMSAMGILAGLIITVTTSPIAYDFLVKYGAVIGLLIIIFATALFLWGRPKKNKDNKP